MTEHDSLSEQVDECMHLRDPSIYITINHSIEKMSLFLCY